MPNTKQFPPIPPLSEPPNWGRLPIAECGEPLVPVVHGEANLRVRALYAEQGIPGAPSTMYVRSGVLERLVIAAQNLPSGVSLLLFDGHRSLQVQQFLWDSFAAQIAQENAGISPDELRLRVGAFVASPTADPACPPPHRTGGAVDVYLVDSRTNEPLPMGTEPDENSPQSVTRYFEDHPQSPFTLNRRTLYHAMTNAGFANYLGEWWHYDFGNQRWANATGQTSAFYGAVSSRQ